MATAAQLKASLLAANSKPNETGEIVGADGEVLSNSQPPADPPVDPLPEPEKEPKKDDEKLTPDSTPPLPESFAPATQPPEQPKVDTTAQTQAATQAQKQVEQGYRYFQHLYAGATFVMRSGHRITFGGPLGGNGTYMTKNHEEIAELADGYYVKDKEGNEVRIRGVADTPGSMITELIPHPKTGVLVSKVEHDYHLEQDQQAALTDSRSNSIRDMDPNVIAARENLPNAIKSGS